MTVTMITVVAIAMVFVVYAATLMTLFGNPITIIDTTGSKVQYSTDGSSWVDTLPDINPNATWYARISIPDAAAQAGVTVHWQLQKNTGTWTNQTTAFSDTSVDLVAGLNAVYASPTNSTSDLYDWGTLTMTSGSYRVRAEVTG